MRTSVCVCARGARSNACSLFPPVYSNGSLLYELRCAGVLRCKRASVFLCCCCCSSCDYSTLDVRLDFLLSFSFFFCSSSCVFERCTVFSVFSRSFFLSPPTPFSLFLSHLVCVLDVENHECLSNTVQRKLKQ